MAATTTHAQVHVGAQGRVVIPAGLRQAAGIAPGDVLVAHVDGEGRLVLEKRQAIIERLQSWFAHLPPGVSLADELIAERRAEAARENAETAEWIKRGQKS